MPSYTSKKNFWTFINWIKDKLSPKADKNNTYTKVEIDSMSEKTGNTYIYDEVNLKKDGVIVSPLTVIDSVKNQDGSNFKDNYYTKDEVNAMLENKNPTFNFRREYQESDGKTVKFTFPFSNILTKYTAKYIYGRGAFAEDYLDTVTIVDEEYKCLCFKVNDLTYVTSFPYTKPVNISKTFTDVIDGFTLTYTLSGTITINSLNDWSFKPILKIKVTKNGYNTKLVDLDGNTISATKKETNEFCMTPDVYDAISVVVDFGKFYWGLSDNLCNLSYEPRRFWIQDEGLIYKTFNLNEELSFTLTTDGCRSWYDECIGITVLDYTCNISFTK